MANMKKMIALLLFSMLLCGCRTIHKKPASISPEVFHEYFPVDEKSIWTYRIHMDDQTIERVMRWEGEDKTNKHWVRFLTDDKGYRKAYEITPESVTLRGISVLNEPEILYYKGENPCLRSPLVVGSTWDIDATLSTPGTLIAQKGFARVLEIGTCGVEAGEFPAVKILFNITSDYHIRETGKQSTVSAQYVVWYGRGAGLLKQYGTALIAEKPNFTRIDLELVSLKGKE